MDIVEIVAYLQSNTGNRVPQVALYGAIVMKMPTRTDVRSLLNDAIKRNELLWGRTPHTTWFATGLSDEDRERIQQYSGWTIEKDIN